jgi:hypothetical protein
MTEPASAPTSDEIDAIRAAAESLKAAIDRHLSAVQARTGEDDPLVQAAYDALRGAAEAYDDLLFETFDEVTPFELADQSDAGEGAAPDLDSDPETLTVLLRRDYDVVDPEALVQSGRAARAELDGEADRMADDPDDTDDEGEEHLGAAVYHLVHAYGVDGLHARAEEIGLEPVGGTLWLVDDVPGELEGDAFAGADPELVRLRLDEIYAVDPPL